MSLQLMKERMKITGRTPREEMIRDGQNLLKEELEHDTSYSPTMFFYDSDNKVDDRLANLRVYGRKNSSLNGNYMNFLTTYDNPVKIGDYIHDTKDDTYWLVYNSFNVNDVHYEGKLIQCNYLLKWQLSDGKVVERWANIVSASKYDTGREGGSVITLSSNNFTVLIGFCEEGYELDGKRVFIDKRDVNPENVFEVTRSDDVLFDSGNMGSLLSFIADKTEFNKDEDRPDLKLCNYIDIGLDDDSSTDADSTTPPTPPENPDEMTDLRAIIKGSTSLTLTYPRSYTTTITDKNNNEVAWDSTCSWNVVGEFDIEQSVDGNKIELYVENEDLIDEKFKLQVLINNVVNSEIIITIASVF